MRGYLKILATISCFVAIVCLNCRTQLDIMMVCPRNYGQALLQTNTSSVTACSLLCASNYTCRSVMYDPATTTCRLSALPTHTDDEEFVYFPNFCTSRVYFVTVKRHTCLDVWMFDPCEVDADCTPLNSACVSTQNTTAPECLCTSGYTYNIRNDTCLPGCATYGKVFSSDIYYFENYDLEETKVGDLHECSVICFSTYAAKCRLFHYIYIKNDFDKCYLSAETTLTKPEATKRLITNPFASTLIRGCA